MLLIIVIIPAAAKKPENSSQAPSAALGEVIALAAGYDSTIALTSNGEVWVWGETHLLIEGRYGYDSPTPILVEGLPAVKAIAAPPDGQHICVLTRSGDVKCWGYNSDGELGTGTTESAYAPVDVIGLDGKVIAISAGLKHSCAVLENGSIQCWGNNAYGKLGNGTTESSLTPISVLGITDATAIALGQQFSCAITRGGRVKCWGDTYYLGTASTGNGAIPVDIVGLSSGVISISAGTSHACVITSDGGVKCWGNSLSGGLGFSETDRYAGGDAPADVVGLTSGVAAISAGGRHTCAILTDGRLMCWGENDPYGNLGIGTNTNHFLPVEVPGITQATAVATGEAHTCAVVNSEVYCWGANTAGQLGDGTQTDRWSPVRVGGGGGFRATGPLVPEITTYIPTPLDLSPKPSVIGTNLFLAALMMLPFAIAAEFFTRTLAENEETLKRRFRPVGWIARMQEWTTRSFGKRVGKTNLSDVLKVIGVMVFYGLVFSLLDKTWNPFSLKGLILFGSMTIAYGLVGVADDIIQWRRIRRWGLNAELKVRPSNILLAAISMATTRILSLIPGLMFGTPEALDADEKQFDELKRNTLLKISGVTFIVIGLIMWLPTIVTGLLLNMKLPELVANLLSGLEAFLLVIFAVALENLFVQMLGFPGSFGQSLKRKSRWLWIILLIFVTFIFYHTLINPRGELAAALEEGNVILFLGVAAAFVVITFGMRLYFWIRNRRLATGRITPLPATPETRAPSPAVPTAETMPNTPGKFESHPAPFPAPAAPVSVTPPQVVPSLGTISPSPIMEMDRTPVVVSSGGEKQCPVCGNTIKAEARLCRFCRATFSVAVRGYCLNDHELVELNEAGKCIRCGNEPADLHVESCLLHPPAVMPTTVGSPRTGAPAQAPAPASDTKQCPNCGQTIKAEARMCRFCMTMLK